MFTIEALKQILSAELYERARQGYDIHEAAQTLAQAGDSYDALFAVAEKIKHAPIRADWAYNEPDELDAVLAECAQDRPTGIIRELSEAEINQRVTSAFLTSVCACILGKPLEEAPYGALEDVQKAAEAVGEWPMRDYVSDAMLSAWGRRNPSWTETTKGRVRFVAPDDDITYSIMGMLLLEKSGAQFTHEEMRQLWIENLPIYMCWGPERTVLLKAGLASLVPNLPYSMTDWVDCLNPGQELCGAMIRADAYGYACPGNPALAARLAYRDASFTHRKTGVYSAMFIAAAIATAFVAKDWREIVETALLFIPQRSRFHEQALESYRLVDQAQTFAEGNRAVHERFAEFTAGQIVQEIGTVINTLKFAKNAEDGIALQVAQGLDSDSFACSCGSILGAYFQEGLPSHWTEPFHDELHTTMGSFYDTSLSSVAARMARLHALL
ncbi:MAG: ADP-ribosylglycohydrolase family protein [Clostridia bacterium]